MPTKSTRMTWPACGFGVPSCRTAPRGDDGFFGSLEVIAKTAFSVFPASLETCKKTSGSEWKTGVKRGQCGPMGEDLLALIFSAKNGHAMEDAFDISSDGQCKAKKPLDQKNTM
eukprot:2406949-Lingulodinium_polyedra.AAC.1